MDNTGTVDATMTDREILKQLVKAWNAWFYHWPDYGDVPMHPPKSLQQLYDAVEIAEAHLRETDE